jgi:hypothetical protein
VKHKNQTFFLPCSRTDSFLTLKTSLSAALGVNTIKAAPNVPPTSIMFYTNSSAEKELPDIGTIQDHEIVNDGIIYAVFCDEKGVWETIEVEGGGGGEETKAAE